MYLVLVQLGTLQEPPDTRREMRAALRAVTEIDLLEHLRQVRVEPLHLLGARQRGSSRPSPDDSRTLRAQQLIRDELHGHRKVERRIAFAGGNADQNMGRLQLLVPQPRSFRTE